MVIRVDRRGYVYIQLGNLYIDGNATHGKFFPFGWFAVYWGDNPLLELD